MFEDGLRDGYSTAGTPDTGLGVIKHKAQVLDADSDAKGAIVMARLFAQQCAELDLPYGAVRVSLHNEVVCGDAWQLAICEQRVTVTLIDGLAHGPCAADAADAGTRAMAAARGEPGELIARLHAGTRGGAAAMQFDSSTGQVRFAGVDSLVASLYDGDGVRGMPSHPGIVGLQFRKAQPFDFPSAAGKLLVMQSDGLQTRWNLRDHPALLSRHLRIVAAVPLRDYARSRDDACVRHAFGRHATPSSDAASAADPLAELDALRQQNQALREELEGTNQSVLALYDELDQQAEPMCASVCRTPASASRPNCTRPCSRILCRWIRRCKKTPDRYRSGAGDLQALRRAAWRQGVDQ